jgi:hypothetical protein
MIVAAAVQYTNPFDESEKLIISLPAPARHGDILKPLWNISRGAHSDCVQGFLTDAGLFLNRKEAYIHAIANAQPWCDNRPGLHHGFENELFSEDLW